MARESGRRAGWGASRTGPRVVAVAALAVLALAGCKHIEDPGARPAWTLADPAERHPILVSQEPQTIELRIGGNAPGLSPRQRADLLEFANRSRASDAGNSRLVISVPSGGANEVAAMDSVGEIRRILSDHGFPESSIAVEGYHEEGRRNPPVRVSYLRYVATPPQCGTWPTNLAREYGNLPYPNFGCATQRNFAVMVANPADLIGPRTESDRPSERRDVVWDKYIHGESTVAKKGEDEKVTTKTSD